MKIPNDPLELSILFKGLRVEELEVLDLGSGKLDSPLSIHMRELPFKRLTLVEKWIRSNRILMQLKDRHQLAAQETTILFEDVWDALMHERAATINSNSRFDVITMLDVVEHLPMESAVIMLIDAKLIARKRVLVWIPIGECPQGDLEGNPYQVHKSVWTQEMLEAIGYQVRVYPQYHKHFDPPVSAAWAVWDREESFVEIVSRERAKPLIFIDEAEAATDHLGVKFIDKEFADMMLNDESIRATEDEAEELRKKYDIKRSSGSSNEDEIEVYENPNREA